MSPTGTTGRLKSFTLLTFCALHCVLGFNPHHLITRNKSFLHNIAKEKRPSSLTSRSINDHDGEKAIEPQAIATGYSQNPDLSSAIKEATTAALEALPPKLHRDQIDLGLVYISSIYDGQSTPTSIVPEIVDIVNDYYRTEGESTILQKLIGCYSGGLVGCKESKIIGQANTIESEGASGVVINLCIMPEANLNHRCSYVIDQLKTNAEMHCECGKFFVNNTPGYPEYC